MIIIVPVAHAQTLNEISNQKSIQVTINLTEEMHVIHVVKNLDIPIQIDLIDGTISNLSVKDQQGNDLQYGTMSDNSLMILPSNKEVIIEYDLGDKLILKDNVWTLDFLYLDNVSFIFPQQIDLVFVDSRPAYLGEKNGILCHGCQMILEYSINEPKILKDVNWEDNEFIIEIQSHSSIDKFNFDQPTKSITFDVSKENQFVTVIIPLELLWKPYSVFLDDEKIFFHEYINNGTHVWVNMKPETTGEVAIIGTTVVPEFPIIAPLAIGFLMIMIMPFVRKFNLH